MNCIDCKYLDIKLNREPCKSRSNGDGGPDALMKYEGIEGMKMKTYKTWEVIKMLTENSKLIFESNGDQIAIKDYQLIWLSTYNNVSLTLNCSMFVDMFNKNWTLVQESVSFMDASKAFGEGKNIRVEFPSSIDENKIITYIFVQSTNGAGVMQSSDDLNFYMINTGKWFIEEEEV
jgi:hypothetical protein